MEEDEKEKTITFYHVSCGSNFIGIFYGISAAVAFGKFL